MIFEQRGICIYCRKMHETLLVGPRSFRLHQRRTFKVVSYDHFGDEELQISDGEVLTRETCGRAKWG